MSSGGHRSFNDKLLRWDQRPSDVEYAQVRYSFATIVDPEVAAMSMALEQSVCMTEFPGADLAPWAARVVEVRDLGPARHDDFEPYCMRYGPLDIDGNRHALRAAEATIAFPLALFGSDYLRMFSVVLGEIPRMGYLGAVRVLGIELPAGKVPESWGPRIGLDGLRKKLGSPNRPILVRSARPACGTATDAMEEVGRATLRGGFDMLKDDELTFDTPLSPAIERYQRMARVAREAEQATGERKLYMANVIASQPRSLELAERAAEAGADALLVAPVAQGMDFPALVARRTGLAVLSHNNGDDYLHRHPRIGFAPEAWIQFQRLGGADMIFLPGGACTPGFDRACSRACVAAAGSGGIPPSLPLIAGGKRPERLAGYAEELGTTNFAVIAATAMDEHPGGLEAGAREFRAAAERLSPAGAACT